MADGAAAAIAEEERAEIGVLLVHGIGEQAEADALLSQGEPLIDWLREWLTGGGPDGLSKGQVHVDAARLRAVRTEAVSPAYARIDINMPRPDGRHSDTERWLFAEAWWSNSVQAPDTARLLIWMFTRLPLIVMWHFFGGQRHAADAVAPQRRIWDVPVPGFVALAAKSMLTPILIVLMQLVVAVALLLWLVPFGAWRQALLDVVRVLTLTLGDSYVLLEQDVQRAALVSRVRLHLQWLQARVQKVVVIAHSQGGAIAHSALADSVPVALFITVGSGLEKLEFLRLVRDRRVGLRAAAFAAPCLVAGVVPLLAGWLGWVPTGTLWGLAPALMLVLACALAWWLVHVMAGYRARMAEVLAHSPVASGAKATTWFDVYATMDMVPMGRASQLPRDGVVTAVELRNECSLVVDHVSYFEQRCGFAAWCWGAMSSVSALPLIKLSQRDALQSIGVWHARRAFALSFGSWLAPLSIVVGVAVFPSAMADIGRGIYGALSAADMTLTYRALQLLTRGLARIVGWVTGLGNEADELAWRTQALTAAVLAGVAVALWWLAVVSAWRADCHARWRVLCHGRSILVGPQALWFGLPMLLMWCLGAMLPVLVVLWASHSPEALTLESFGRAAATLLAGIFLACGLMGGWVTPWLPSQDLEKDQLGSTPHLMWPLLCAFAMAVWGALGIWLWTLASGGALAPGLVAVAAIGCVVSWFIVLGRTGPVPAWVWALLVLLPAAAVAAARLSEPLPSLDEMAGGYAVLCLALVGLWRWWRVR